MSLISCHCSHDSFSVLSVVLFPLLAQTEECLLGRACTDFSVLQVVNSPQGGQVSRLEDSLST